MTIAPAIWDGQSDGVVVCRAVRDETHDVKTFIFSGSAPRRFAYQPGQFLTFEFEIDGRRLNRCYTLASTPTRPDRVSITVKRVPGGPVSNWLHDNLRPGMSLNALGPMGDFTCAAQSPGRYLFLSAGSGVTPLMSMTRAQHDLASGADVVFVHSARTPADVIFADELAVMARGGTGLCIATVCETDGAPGYAGRLDTAMLLRIAPDVRQREVFVCGPAAYMASVRDILGGIGFEMARYHQESFDFADLAPQPIQPIAADGFAVTFSQSGRTLVCGADTFVLSAARQAGMRLPSSCTQGMCGTCKSRLVSGTVEMNHAGGIRQREIDQGWILLCCSRPTSDLVIER